MFLSHTFFLALADGFRFCLQLEVFYKNNSKDDNMLPVLSLRKRRVVLCGGLSVIPAVGMPNPTCCGPRFVLFP